jgi:hypothetical protein
MPLTEESAFFALNGPKDQQIHRLREIIVECDSSDEPFASELRDEAEAYLGELLA